MRLREPAYRGLRRHRRPPHGRPRRAGRLDRLALPAPLRLGRLLRPPARRRVQRLLADRADRRRRRHGHGHPPPLPRGHARARDRVRHCRPARCASPTACPSARTSPRWCGWSRCSRATVTVRMELCLRFGYGARHALGHPARRPAHGHRRAGLGRAVDPRRDPRRGPEDGRRAHAARGPADPVHPDLVPFPRAVPAADRPVLRARRRPRTGGRPGPTRAPTTGEYREAVVALAHHAEGAHLRADRRHRGGGHDLAARGPRAATATGTTATAGCATPPSPSRRSCAAGYHEEAMAWRDWLLRATAGDVSKLQIMYGASGERRLDEWEVDWLAGYEGSTPVRIGNAAAGQYQLDVYGEVMSALYRGQPVRRDHQHGGVGAADGAGRVPRGGLEAARRRHLGGARAAPPLHALQGDGLGGGRPRRADARGVAGPRGPARPLAGAARRDPRRGLREGLRREAAGLHPVLRLRRARRQHPHAPARRLPAARGPARDPTVEAIERELVDDGFVLRYRTSDDGAVDGLTGARARSSPARSGSPTACT